MSKQQFNCKVCGHTCNPDAAKHWNCHDGITYYCPKCGVLIKKYRAFQNWIEEIEDE